MSNEDQQQQGAENSGDGKEKSDNVEVLKADNAKFKAMADRRKKRLLEYETEDGKPKPKSDSTTDKKKQSSEPDYAKEAFLEQRGVKHPDDKKVIYEEAERLKMPLTDVLGMDYIKSKLKNAQDQREASDGTPKGRGRGSSKARSDVDYWVDKKDKDGNYQTPDDMELAEKVINARIKKEERGNMFADKMY